MARGKAGARRPLAAIALSRPKEALIVRGQAVNKESSVGQCTGCISGPATGAKVFSSRMNNFA